MAITQEKKISIRSEKIPSAYVKDTQVYFPTSFAAKIRNQTFDVAIAGVANATNLTGFDNLLAQITTDFTANVLPGMGLDATQTISILIDIIDIDRNNDAIADDLDGENLYKIGVDVWTVKYHICTEETA